MKAKDFQIFLYLRNIPKLSVSVYFQIFLGLDAVHKFIHNICMIKTEVFKDPRIPQLNSLRSFSVKNLTGPR